MTQQLLFLYEGTAENCSKKPVVYKCSACRCALWGVNPSRTPPEYAYRETPKNGLLAHMLQCHVISTTDFHSSLLWFSVSCSMKCRIQHAAVSGNRFTSEIIILDMHTVQCNITITNEYVEENICTTMIVILAHNGRL